MAEMLEVFTAEPCEIDWLCFDLWLQGYNLEDACKVREEKESEITRMFDGYEHLLRLETEHYFRMFKTLDSFLHSPPSLFSQSLLRVSDPSKHDLIARYYSFDSGVVRELLGKKMSSKHRKDLDDISQTTGAGMRSCRRQFDNVKRVLRSVEDQEGPLVANIRAQFCLPEGLARQYAAVVFISVSRFETMKRATSRLPLRDFVVCATKLIDDWTVGSEDANSELRTAADDDLELERNFLQKLHDMKGVLLEKTWTERWQKAVMKDLKRRLPAPTCKLIEGQFKTLLRNLITHGSCLLHSKDLKDFFVDTLENLVFPLQEMGLSYGDVEVLLATLLATFPEVEGTLRKPSSKPSPWESTYKRYMGVMTTCILQLFHPL